MANNCLPQIHACAIRVARLFSTGVPAPGANNLYVSDALTRLQFEPETEAGDEITVKNGCGEICLSHKAQDTVKRWNVTLELCTPDPELHELLAGGVVITDGDAVGYGAPHLNETENEDGVSIELWAHRVTSGGGFDADFPYAHWIFPRMYLIPGSREHANAAHNSPFTGHIDENPNWHDGPANDWPTPAESDRPWAWVPTDTLPTASCGYQTLVGS